MDGAPERCTRSAATATAETRRRAAGREREFSETVPNVCLAKKTSNPAGYLVVGDTKSWTVDAAEFDALGFRWPKVLVVEMSAATSHIERTSIICAARSRQSER
jgi:hypothetical protein